MSCNGTTQKKTSKTLVLDYEGKSEKRDDKMTNRNISEARGLPSFPFQERKG
jgi:hypothetical protein